MKMNVVVDILNANGIKAELSSANKAGKEIPCVRFGEGRVTPTAYQSTWDSFETDEEVIDFARKAIANTPEISVDEFFTKEYVLKNAISCIRHETEDDKTLRFAVFGDLEEYIRIPVNMSDGCNGSVVVLNQHIEALGINPNELRTAARDNLRKHVIIQSMREVLSEMMGASFEDVPEIGEDFMYVGTVDTRIQGASVMLLEDVLRKFCIEHNLSSIRILPCSIHEIIIIADEHEESMINGMINDVNMTQIADKTEILSDHFYRFVA